jgi:hypothetical protein
MLFYVAHWGFGISKNLLAPLARICAIGSPREAGIPNEMIRVLNIFNCDVYQFVEKRLRYFNLHAAFAAIV